jgi:hypothetical protein
MVNMARKGDQKDDVPYLHLYMSFAYFPQFDSLAGSSCVVHSEPVANPPAFSELDTLKATVDMTKVRNLTELMKDIDYWNPSGLRSVTDLCTRSNRLTYLC